MKRHRLSAAGVVLFGICALGGLGLAGSGCQASASVGAGGDDNGVPANCTADNTVDCSGGGDGYSCDPGDNPEAEDSSLSCSTPTSDPNGGDDYCCFTWAPVGGGTTCTPDDDLTSACPDPDSYGYQCQDPSDDPTSLDPSLNCSQGVADGSSTDFCCTYGSSGGSSSSGGTVPANCTADPSVDCSGGGDGYSCDAGDNPEVEDSTLSCSTPTADPNGGDDYCCFTWAPVGGSTSCTPDDELTASCADPDSYGYQCADPSDDPTSLDPSLNCSQGVADPDGTDTDFCCTYN